MKVLLLQLDGKIPNLALMRIAAHLPFVRNRELVGFQRWVIGAYDKRFSWAQWEAAKYRPENL